MRISIALFLAASATSFLRLPCLAQEEIPPAAPDLLAPLPKPITPETKGKLSFKVLIVDDLVAKPVPLSDFKIQLIGQDNKPLGDSIVSRTNEGGSLAIELLPGRYAIRSAKPLRVKGRLYEWNREFSVAAGETTTLQMTGDDATVKDEAIPTTRQVADEAKVYRALVDGVATVEAEGGHGTGFLVDASGLIVTNHHVVAGSQSIVVRFRPGLRVQAKVVQVDPDSDVAILRVNPEVVRGLPVLSLSQVKQDEPILVEGEKVLAIGSPLSEEKVLTTGLVSRIKEDVIISDVNINPGNSGGPLINLAGEVVGLTTFGESSSQSGPGLSGIVSVRRVWPILQKVREKSAAPGGDTATPSANLLPDFLPVAVPASLLTAAAETELEMPLLHAPSSFETRFYTPFIAASLRGKAQRDLDKKRKKRQSKQRENSEAQPDEKPSQKFYDTSEAQVLITVAPALMESKSSKKKGLFGSMLGVNTKKSYEFRHDFYDMELWRDGVKVEPLRRQRIPMSVYFDNGYFDAKDTAKAGAYSYDPTAFRPGGKLQLIVRREYNTENPDTVKISEALQATLYNQFNAFWKYAGSVKTSATTAEH